MKKGYIAQRCWSHTSTVSIVIIARKMCAKHSSIFMQWNKQNGTEGVKKAAA